MRFSTRDLKILGVSMYKCEGAKLRRDKRHPATVYYSIDFTNTDPLLVCVFIEFLRRVINVQEGKIRIALNIHEDVDSHAAIRYWSAQTHIPASQFYRPTVIVKRSGKYKVSPFGTCKVRYISKESYGKLDEVIREVLGDSAGLFNAFTVGCESG